jgi:hypothetical protein
MKVEIKRFVANEIFCRVWWLDPSTGDGITVDTSLPMSEEFLTSETAVWANIGVCHFTFRRRLDGSYERILTAGFSRST